MKDAHDIWATELVNAAARIAENFHVLETCQAITTLFEANGQTYRLRVHPVGPPRAAVAAGHSPDTAGLSPAAGEKS